MAPPRQNPAIPPSIRNILSVHSQRNLDTFDPWNSASTGHQVGDSSSGTGGWRAVRETKLAAQLGAGSGKRKREGQQGEWVLLDEAGREAVEGRENGERDIRGYFGIGKKRIEREEKETRTVTVAESSSYEEERDRALLGSEGRNMNFFSPQKGTTSSKVDNRRHFEEEDIPDDDIPPPSAQPSPPPPSTVVAADPIHKGTPKPKPIFANLTFYINGSTAPQISDHKLKNILVSHGGRISIYLARKAVTHVILGTPSQSKASSGAGGGLAAGKLQYEIRRVGGEGIKYVGVEWILESVKAGCRLPEARFANLHMAAEKQGSVLEHFSKA